MMSTMELLRKDIRRKFRLIIMIIVIYNLDKYHERPLGRGARVGAPPPPTLEKKVYLYGWPFSPCRGPFLSSWRVIFVLIVGHIFPYGVPFLSLWEAIFVLMGGLFWACPHPTKISAGAHENSRH